MKVKVIPILVCCFLMVAFSILNAAEMGKGTNKISLEELKTISAKVDKLSSEKNYKEGIKLLSDILKNYSQNSVLLQMMGKLYVENGEPNLSISFLEKALNIAETDFDKAWVHYWLSRAYRDLGDIEKAKTNIQKALQYLPKNDIFKEQSSNLAQQKGKDRK